MPTEGETKGSPLNKISLSKAGWLTAASTATSAPDDGAHYSFGSSLDIKILVSVRMYVRAGVF